MKILLAVLIGFGLGAILFHSPTIKAAGGNVHVWPAKPNAGVGIVGEAFGFSCVSNSSGEAECFVASRENEKE
jgi:hypothetical protein